jgi:type IV secretion system protein VirD4
VVASAQAPLLVFMNPVLDRATSADDFWLTDLRRKVTTIYVGIAPNKMTEASGILNLFFQQAIKLNSSELPQQNPELKYQCLFLLDEFTSMGRVEILVDGPSYLAGYNVRIFCVIQSLSQLDAVYGPEKARSMVTNLACQVVYTPREQRDANEYSEMLGFKTVRRRQRTRSRGQGSSISYTEIEEKVELMKPQDLKALSPEKEIVFIEGTPHPVMADKIRYYKDRYFTARLMNPVVVKPLEIGRAER